MTFLQPFILWGLPLVLVPLIIHLINRLRHRPQAWAAMQFLLSATKSSVSHAKLRQWLVLAMRMLAVAALVFFLARPLAGGWLGWALSPAPDTILMLLDRSASMETRLPGTKVTRREQALRRLREAAQPFAGVSHLVLIESALRTAHEVHDLAAMENLSAVAATDTAADWPALFQAAMQWLVENRAGTAELWVASDLQSSNWVPEDPRWERLVEQLTAMPQKIRIRLLTFGPQPEVNVGVTVRELIRRKAVQPTGAGNELSLAVDVQRLPESKETLPITLRLNGVDRVQEVELDGTTFRWRQRVPLEAGAQGGWGRLQVPTDANDQDNTSYFVYGPEAPLRGVVVAVDPVVGRYGQLALAAAAGADRAEMKVLSWGDAAAMNLDAASLVMWQGPMPDELLGERLRSFVREGGVLLLLPSGKAEGQRFSGVAWGEVETARDETPFRLARWDQDEGPWAKSDEGIALPLGQETMRRRQMLIRPGDEGVVMASFEDGQIGLLRQSMGQGEVYFCATLPRRDWSSLGQGSVWVPMVRRLLEFGSRRSVQAQMVACGDLGPAEAARRWERADGAVMNAGVSDVRLHAGVYRSGDRWLAVNRPVREDEVGLVSEADLRQVLGRLPVQLLEERGLAQGALQGEIWRVVVLLMLTFLLVEAWLVVPTRHAGAGASAAASSVGVAVSGLEGKR